MIIKNIEEFGSINEGILSFFGIGDSFSSKKSKLENILKKIKKSKEEDLNNRTQNEKDIANLTNDNSPEYRFNVSNLNRQSRVYSSLKEQEISALIKEANNIIKNDPKAQTFFSSEFAKIEAGIADKFLRNMKQYKDETYLEDLNREFDELVKDANRKSNLYNEYKEKDGYFPIADFSDVSEEALKFIDLSNQESYSKLRTYTDEQLSKILKEVKTLTFNLDMEYQKSIDSIRKDIKKARKEGQDWFLQTLETQERELRYYMKKPLEKIKYKISLIEKEIRARKYDYQNR